MAELTHVPSGLPPRIAGKIRVDPGSGCWLWQAALGGDGYGRAWMPGGTGGMAHRVVYELLAGKIPSGLHLDHICGVRHCVNPDHLEPVTWKENNRRAGLKRRQDTCVRGHLMEGENVAFRPSSEARYCRECNRVQALAWRNARDPEAVREQRQEHYQTPEYQQWLKEYHSRPEVRRREAARARRVRAQRLIDGKPCSVEGCDKPVDARGWCKTHYSRWYRSKETDMAKQSAGRPIPPLPTPPKNARGIPDGNPSREPQRPAPTVDGQPVSPAVARPRRSPAAAAGHPDPGGNR